MNQKGMISIILLMSLVVLVGGGIYISQTDIFNDRDLFSRRGKFVQNIENRKQIKQEVLNRLDLERLTESTGLEGLNETDAYIEVENTATASITDSQVSGYQGYVTPNAPAVQALATGKTYEQIYKESVGWIWVEDEVMHGEVEKWLLPQTFLTETPEWPTNPVTGNIASDCESQAYTLVSALRAAGMPAEYVRVVTGKVNFGESVGGHAWVEVYDEVLDGWFQLEATSGSYYDSIQQELVEADGVSYNYFKTYQYPSLQIWTYFNDEYFWDNSRQEGVVPELWLTSDTVEKQPNPAEVIFQLPEDVQDRREERIQRLQDALETIDTDEVRRRLEDLRTQATNSTLTADQLEQELANIKVEYGNNVNATITSIRRQVLYMLELAELKVENGLTPAQQEEVDVILQNAIDEAYVLIAQSDLSAEEKAQLTAVLREFEQRYQDGLTPAEKAAIQTQLITTLNRIETEVEEGSFEERIRNQRLDRLQ